MYKYTENAIENYGENTSHGLLLKHIPRGSRVLEFGCGKGVFARYITETLDCSVTGVDISEEAIEITGAHIEKALVANLDRKGWQEEIPYRDYDVIVCADLLEHLASPERFLVQVRELLKDDGKLIFSVPNIAHADVLANLFLGNFIHTAVQGVKQTLCKVCSCAEELHFLTDSHGRNATCDGIVITSAYTHQIIILILDCRSEDGELCTVFFESCRKSSGPENGQVGLGSRS